MGSAIYFCLACFYFLTENALRQEHGLPVTITYWTGVNDDWKNWEIPEN